jgi:hypothetical protein
MAMHSMSVAFTVLYTGLLDHQVLREKTLAINLIKEYKICHEKYTFDNLFCICI